MIDRSLGQRLSQQFQLRQEKDEEGHQTRVKHPHIQTGDENQEQEPPLESKAWIYKTSQ
ncbi:hypothetical protein JOB18_038742 [Solea senegalensis]|uniref:Uncharacterized protein n=1 Tax=Solea senegalensis TaxID=28829 RepID=A0AAV6S0T4_SOLSE|nr:hypothetical protein JOB18_038742 [Solea senegalensis]